MGTHVCVDTCVDMCVYGHMCRHVCMDTYVDMCAWTPIPTTGGASDLCGSTTCIIMRVNIFIDPCIDVRIETRIDMCMGPMSW